MDSTPQIFISAVPSELKTAALELAETLRLLDFTSALQDEHLDQAETTGGMLEQDFAASSAVIQLVGQRYGRIVTDASDTLSWCRYLAQAAHQKSLPVWYFVMADNFPGDQVNDESTDLKMKQRAYRSTLQDGVHPCFPIRSLADIEPAVLKIHSELLALRQPKPQPSKIPKTIDQLALSMPSMSPKADSATSLLKRTALIKTPPTFLADFLTTIQEVQQGDADDEARREQEQYAHLAMIMGKSVEDARSLIRSLAQKTSLDPSEPILEQAKAAFLLKQYVQAEALALQAGAALKDPETRADAFYQAGQAAAEQVQSLRALEHYRHAATYTRQPHAPIDWARVQHMIAYTLDDLGRANEAEPILLEVIEAREQTLGREHPDTLTSRNNLAMAYQAQGKHLEEEQQRRIIMEIRERNLGPEHLATLRTRYHLAVALKSQGKRSEADQEFATVQTIRERLAGTGDSNARRSQANATKEYRDVVTSMEKLYGPSHQDTLLSRRKLADALESTGSFTEAEKEYRTVLKHTEELYGPQDPDSLSSRNNLAIFLYSRMDFPAAEMELKKVLSLMELVHSKDHPKVYRCCYNLAACLQKQSKPQAALAQAQRAFLGWSQAFGEDHSDTQDAKKMIERLENP
jgi:tetratricopeptide (TPR) repeat protein